MESLIPPSLIAMKEIRWHLENGQSTRESVRLFCQNSNIELAKHLSTWLLQHQSGSRPQLSMESSYQKALFALLERGLSGQPILEALQALESETLRAASSELDTHVGRLPFLSMVPLFTFQFPAYLILLIGPIFSQLLQQMGGS